MGQDLNKLAQESLAALGLEPGERDQGKIRTQFRMLTLRWHPDKQAGKSDQEKEQAQQMYAKIDAAYKFLSSPAYVQL
ncbi:DnaJ domain-containing protein [Herbaspirillum rubrisubalbicans M1]|nr:DnaJ domain-containing protein [Herbaspirillum rubrisubalbicans M1]